jgi:tRNA pseudouridine(55) synthase
VLKLQVNPRLLFSADELKKTYRPLVMSISKPPGISSFDCVRFFKKNYATKTMKVGHFGTLDPFAAGLLLLGFNRAARLNDLIHEFCPKTYIACGKMGLQTDTGDHTGKIIQVDESDFFQKNMPQFPLSHLQATWDKFQGNYEQSPPAFSATKYEGKPLHEWARQGIMIPKEKVQREIYALKVLKWRHPYVSFQVTVSSGTYIRVLFEDLCREFGCLGTLIGLVRSQIGLISLKSATLLSTIRSAAPIEVYDPRVFFSFPSLTFTKASQEYQALVNGDVRFLDGGDKSSPFLWLIDEEDQIMALVNLRDFSRPQVQINFLPINSAFA